MLENIEKISFQSLTPRELEILQLIAEGYSNESIRMQCNIVIRTVERHIRNIYQAFGMVGTGRRNPLWSTRVVVTLIYQRNTHNGN